MIIKGEDKHFLSRKIDTNSTLMETNPAFYHEPDDVKIEVNPVGSGPSQEHFTDQEKSQTDTLHFWDGERKVDMILAYGDEDEGEDGEKKAEKRKTFQRNLEEQGLELELEPSNRSADRKTNFLKVHAPWDLLTRYAEIFNLKMPIKEEADPLDEVCGCVRWPKPFDYDENLIPPEPNFFTTGFLMDKEDRFIIKDRETFFSSAQRSQMVWQILMRTSYDDEDSDKVGIIRLLSNGVFKDVYPLHDGRAMKDEHKDHLCSRRILYLEWAKMGAFYKKQPLWLIKRYFGDKIGLYFAWLGFYTQMLIPAALMGLAVFIYGLVTMNSEDNYPVNDICDLNKMGNETLCPNCEKDCDFITLHSSCLVAKVTYTVDNSTTVFFAIFMSLWATAFNEFWKRRQAVIVWEWDLTNFDEEEQTRPEFEAHVKTTRINPVTKKAEPYLPSFSKMYRVTFTMSIVLTMLMVVIVTVASIMLFKIVFTSTAFQITQDGSAFHFLNQQARLVATMLAATLNLIAIVILNKIYERIALWLTKIEYPRTQSDFEQSYTVKVFLFQTLNFYASLIYVAFIKGRAFRDPGYLTGGNIEKFQADQCDPGGCLYELALQLAIIMIGKQFFNNFIEIAYPKLVTFWKRYVYRKRIEDSAGVEDGSKIYTRWEHDYNLQSVDRLDLLDEYLEMVIQYGFITLFVAAFPLAPLFALLNNVLEIRIDAIKYTTVLKRPIAQRAQDIGVWLPIIQTITYLSVLTNGLVIAMTSDFIPKMVYKYGVSDNGGYEGYRAWTLTTFNTSDYGIRGSENFTGPTKYNNLTDVEAQKDWKESCLFPGFKENQSPYEYSADFYFVWMGRLVFLVLFQNIVYGVTGLISVLIPDVPSGVKVQIQREKLLAREVLFEAELNDEKEKRKSKKAREESDENLNVSLRKRPVVTTDEQDILDTIIDDDNSLKF